MSGVDAGMTVGDVVELIRGTTYKGALLGQPGPVLLGLSSIARNGGFRNDSLRTYGGASPDKLILREGDIYVSLKDVTQSADLLGAVARVPAEVGRGRLTQDTLKLVFKNNDVPREYVYWLLRTPQYRAYCRAHATGTTTLGLSRDDFLGFPVPEVTPDRLALVDLLEGLEDKLNLNRQTNQTLGQLAQRLFKSWFVDFDPVKAKMEGREPAYMDAETAALFPDRLVEGELGMTPEGWSVRELGSLVQNVRVGIAAQDISDEDAYVGLEHFEKRTLWLENWGSGKDVASNKSCFERGDLLFGKLRPYFHKVAIAPMDGLCSTDVLVLRARSACARAFSYLALNQKELVDFAARTSTGTRMPRANWTTLSGYRVAVPPQPVLEAFERLCGILLERLMRPSIENRALAELRDRLLPKLISGQIRIRDAEKQVERAI